MSVCVYVCLCDIYVCVCSMFNVQCSILFYCILLLCILMSISAKGLDIVLLSHTLYGFLHVYIFYICSGK